jgi:hypothetical protein
LDENKPEEPQRLPFDKAICKRFQDLIQELLLEYPELRSVAVVLDYVDDLNDGGASRGLWAGDNGPVHTLAGVHGSITQTLRMLEMMFVRATQVSDQMRAEAAVIGQELVRRKKELEALRGEEDPQAEGSASES